MFASQSGLYFEVYYTPHQIVLPVKKNRCRFKEPETYGSVPSTVSYEPVVCESEPMCSVALSFVQSSSLIMEAPTVAMQDGEQQVVISLVLKNVFTHGVVIGFVTWPRNEKKNSRKASDCKSKGEEYYLKQSIIF